MASAIAVRLEDPSWQKAHEELVRLATERAGLDFEEGRGLLRAHRAGAHVWLGYASFHEYTERLFGYGPRLSQEKLRVAEGLEELPETARDLQKRCHQLLPRARADSRRDAVHRARVARSRPGADRA